MLLLCCCSVAAVVGGVVAVVGVVPCFCSVVIVVVAAVFSDGVQHMHMESTNTNEMQNPEIMCWLNWANSKLFELRGANAKQRP